MIEERSRIAREIHDTLAQGFSGIALQLQGVSKSLEQETSVAKTHLEMALQMVRRSRAEAHRSIATLRTLHSDEELARSLEKLLRQLTDPANITLLVLLQGTAFRMGDETSSQILRIAQEAVANVIEHARATKVVATLIYSLSSVELVIQDDGCGFDVNNMNSIDTGHFGIAGMRERARQIGASFSLESDTSGTRIILAIRRAGFGMARRSAWHSIRRRVAAKAETSGVSI